MSMSAKPKPAGIMPDSAPIGCTAWVPGQFGQVPPAHQIALIGAQDVYPILPDFDLWDCWPLQCEDGRTAVIDGAEWWFFLSAPRFADPGQRHDAARIRMVSRRGQRWDDHGTVIDPAATPGSREWAGSAVLKDDGQTVALFFTAAGRRGQHQSYEQRIFQTVGCLTKGVPGDFGRPQELFVADGTRYVAVRQAEGSPGFIKGFRDPAWFRDPADGAAHLLFTGSAGWDSNDFNGVIGIATQGTDGIWHLADPLVSAIGVNNELERPHILCRSGRYYLFWSTQRRTFAPHGNAGPNGLYGMVADRLGGPWQPLNGNGLVAANPADEPTQAYSWWVTGEGSVWSFVDHWGLAGRSIAEHPSLLRNNFGGTPAPVFQLCFEADRVRIDR